MLCWCKIIYVSNKYLRRWLNNWLNNQLEQANVPWEFKTEKYKSVIDTADYMCLSYTSAYYVRIIY